MFEDKDVHILFNSFLNTYLRLFYTSFLLKSPKSSINSKEWITPSIKMQCHLKRGLYLLSKNNTDSNLKNCYKALRKSLSNNITKAKCSYYNKLLHNSNNKTSATWAVVKTETCRTNTNEGVTTISVNGNLIDNPQLISDSFNNHFLSVADKIKKIIAYRTLIAIFPLSHVYQMQPKKTVPTD
jgi:hypothetical protein